MDGSAPAPVVMVRAHLTGLPVYKMTGSGNDFVMLDGRSANPDDWTAADIRAVCARGTGVGADGVTFVAPGSQPGAVRMLYFNSDGSRPAMCGNAALCTTWLAARLGMASPAGMRLETDAGVFESRCVPPPGPPTDGQAAAAAENPLPGAARAALAFAPVDPPIDVPGLPTLPGERAALVRAGVPHLVVLVPHLDLVDVAVRGRALRHHPALGAEGANVNFVGARGGAVAREWGIRTYERGVEGETLACGTGAVAAGCALAAWGLTDLPVSLLTRSGQCLDVQARKLPGGQYGDVWLTGEARLVFRGVLT